MRPAFPRRDDIEFYLFLLASTDELGPVSIKRIIEYCELRGGLLYIEDSFLKNGAKLTDIQANGLKRTLEAKDYYFNEYSKIWDTDIEFVTLYNHEYPEKLRTINDPPAILFYRGKLPDSSVRSAALVGSRSATTYGTGMASWFAEQLAESGVDIISGMAVGIDTAGHRGALKGGGKTYGVMGCGLNVCYPKENYELFELLASGSYGGVISEIVPGISAKGRNFPMRNRIISGISDITVIVEAREKSGSLITAKMAIDQNRDVGAIPGRITDPMSKGCNKLISQGAYMISAPSDVLNILGINAGRKSDENVKINKILAKNEKKVYSTLDSAPKYTDEIVNETGLTCSEVSTALLELELKGMITRISGNYYGLVY